jgi:hypothetical protein
MSLDLEKISFLCEVILSENEVNSWKHVILFFTLTTALLKEHSIELSVVASHYNYITLLLNQLETLLNKIEIEWKETKNEFNSIFTQLHKMILSTLRYFFDKYEKKGEKERTCVSAFVSVFN